MFIPTPTMCLWNLVLQKSLIPLDPNPSSTPKSLPLICNYVLQRKPQFLTEIRIKSRIEISENVTKFYNA